MSLPEFGKVLPRQEEGLFGEWPLTRHTPQVLVHIDMTARTIQSGCRRDFGWTLWQKATSVSAKLIWSIRFACSLLPPYPPYAAPNAEIFSNKDWVSCPRLGQKVESVMPKIRSNAKNLSTQDWVRFLKK